MNANFMNFSSVIATKVHLDALQDEISSNIERAKLRMRLRWTQAHLDAFRRRYRQAVEESDNMNKQFEEASANLKERLASKGIEVLNLKKQLAAAMGQ